VVCCAVLCLRYGGTGKKSHGRQFDSYGEEYSKGDVIGCLLDTLAATISFSKNGKVFGPAFQIPSFLQGQVNSPGGVGEGLG